MESSLVHLTGAALRKETPVENMIKGLCWLGARADRYDDMKHFCHQVLGLALDHEEPDFVAFKLPDGSVVEVFGPSDEEHAYFGTGPVAGFEVDDIEAARARLEGAGVEFIGPIHRSEPTNQAWSHFRAPDGNVYEPTQPSFTS
jgi:catechol 2,3-dioxygenase-like lactoylglutathione lyase family enzyme